MSTQEPEFVSGMTIEAISDRCNRYAEAAWRPLYEEMHERLTESFAEIEDAAYGLYLDRLLPPLFDGLEEAGYQLMGEVGEEDFIIGKRLNFSDSLEKAAWGTPSSESRVFWNVVRDPGGEPVGTLAMELVHSHLGFDIPTAPRFHALAQTERKGILAEIRRIKEDDS